MSIKSNTYFFRCFRRYLPAPALLLCLATFGVPQSPAHTLNPGPVFRTPIVTDRHIIFAAVVHVDDPGRSDLIDAKRLVCIRKRDGEKVWEKSFFEEVQGWFAVGTQYTLITKGSDIFKCDNNTGRFKLFMSTSFEHFSYAEPLKLPNFLLVGIDEDSNGTLLKMDLEKGAGSWQVRNAADVLAIGKQNILCYRQRYIRVGERSWQSRNLGICAISSAEGIIMWKLPVGPTGLPLYRAAAVKDYFVVADGDTETISSHVQTTGEVIASRPLEAFYLTTMVPQETSVAMWLPQLEDQSHLMSFSVPKLKEKILLKASSKEGVNLIALQGDIFVGHHASYHGKSGKRIWRMGNWRCQADMEKGWMYFSSIDQNWECTKIEKIDISSGERITLYKEHLPEAYHWDTRFGDSQSEFESGR